MKKKSASASTQPECLDETIRAHLVLKGSSLTASSSPYPTAASIQKSGQTEEEIQRTAGLLNDLGLKVLYHSPLQITVEAPRKQLEAVFSSSLRQVKPAKSQTAGSVPAGPYWAWREQPTVPPELLARVENVVLPQPIHFA